ncbi:hypothetical protein PR048_000699 [Dryococelus australis]|uniref:Uncharacterized protein n=1 Tax=Dryococelus australis TaxID=614101 RepID=A0ABQ9IFC3_9NEOP|nr:hypothetical protein PR048_000699 [Dryococelus australis]
MTFFPREAAPGDLQSSVILPKDPERERLEEEKRNEPTEKSWELEKGTQRLATVSFRSSEGRRHNCQLPVDETVLSEPRFTEKNKTETAASNTNSSHALQKNGGSSIYSRFLERNVTGSDTDNRKHFTPRISKARHEAALNNRVLRANEGEASLYRKTCRPSASPDTIPTCDNPDARPAGIEPGSPWWEASAQPAVRIWGQALSQSSAGRIKFRELIEEYVKPYPHVPRNFTSVGSQFSRHAPDDFRPITKRKTRTEFRATWTAEFSLAVLQRDMVRYLEVFSQYKQFEEFRKRRSFCFTGGKKCILSQFTGQGRGRGGVVVRLLASHLDESVRSPAGLLVTCCRAQPAASRPSGKLPCSLEFLHRMRPNSRDCRVSELEWHSLQMAGDSYSSTQFAVLAGRYQITPKSLLGQRGHYLLWTNRTPLTRSWPNHVQTRRKKKCVLTAAGANKEVAPARTCIGRLSNAIGCCVLEKASSYLTGLLMNRQHRHGTYVLRVKTVNTSQKKYSANQDNCCFVSLQMKTFQLPPQASANEDGISSHRSYTSSKLKRELKERNRSGRRRGAATISSLSGIRKPPRFSWTYEPTYTLEKAVHDEISSFESPANIYLYTQMELLSIHRYKLSWAHVSSPFDGECYRGMLTDHVVHPFLRQQHLAEDLHLRQTMHRPPSLPNCDRPAPTDLRALWRLYNGHGPTSMTSVIYRSFVEPNMPRRITTVIRRKRVVHATKAGCKNGEHVIRPGTGAYVPVKWEFRGARKDNGK